jgi:hypothetical protein
MFIFAESLLGEQASASEGGANILDEHDGLVTGSCRWLRFSIDSHYVAGQTLLGRLVVTMLDEGCHELQPVAFVDRTAIGSVQLPPAPALLVFADLGHFFPGQLANNVRDGVGARRGCT